MTLGTLLFVAGRAGAAPPKVHVRAGAQLDASLTPADGDALAIRGEIRDDAQAAIAGAPITVRIVAPRATAIALPAVKACGATPRGSVRVASGSDIAVESDERGSFCVALAPAPPAGTSVRVTFSGTKLHDPTDEELTVGAEPSPPARPILRFDPAMPLVDLDHDEAPVAVTVRIERGDGARAPSRREGLVIQLDDERGRRLAEAPSGGDGRARFVVKTSALEGPGPGELRAHFDGTDALSTAVATQPLARVAQVRLALARPVPEGDPEDGVPIDVTVGSSRGAVDGGVVEALRGDESVGAGEVAAGKARVLATFPAERAGAVPLVLRYVPAAPWWRPGAELPVELRVAGPGAWRQALLALVVASLAAWVVRGWRRAPKPPETRRDSLAPGAPSGRAGVQVIEAPRGFEGWRGRVVDAHDGTPIAGAKLAVIVPSFEGDGVVSRAETDARGEFDLPQSTALDARLSIESALHTSHEQALPPPSVLAVALITRRRALLDRLVRWARRYGQPFDGPPEPTPGHVRRVASRTNSADVEAWARRVEAAAFGPDVVDAEAERAAREGEPGQPNR